MGRYVFFLLAGVIGATFSLPHNHETPHSQPGHSGTDPTTTTTTTLEPQHDSGNEKTSSLVHSPGHPSDEQPDLTFNEKNDSESEGEFHIFPEREDQKDENEHKSTEGKGGEGDSEGDSVGDNNEGKGHGNDKKDGNSQNEGEKNEKEEHDSKPEEPH